MDSTGSGGSSGSGGAASSGGTTGSGGTIGSGGTTGSGGASASGGAAASGGAVGTGGSEGTGGRVGSGGATGSGGAAGGATGSGGSGSGGAGAGGAGALPHFSFFATSLAALQKLSQNDNGFGGDLRYGEANGLAGADKICATIAEMSMPGSASKQWRAFLSTASNPSQVNAKDRIGAGPWYDRKGNLIAMNLTNLLMTRPADAPAAIQNDLPNEDGIPNQNPDGNGNVDNHDFLTGTGIDGNLYVPGVNGGNPAMGGPPGGGGTTTGTLTCNDWTTVEEAMNMGPWCGHSWGAMSGQDWKSALREGGCGAGINLKQQGGNQKGVYTVGTGGGYGGFYCFALTP
jgi:hypothetical protein